MRATMQRINSTGTGWSGGSAHRRGVTLAIVSGAFMASCVGARGDLPDTVKYFSERTFMVAHIDTIALLDSPIGETLRGTPMFPHLHPTEDLSFGPRLNLEDFTSYTIAWGRSDGADEPYKHTYYSTVKPLVVEEFLSRLPDEPILTFSDLDGNSDAHIYFRGKFQEDGEYSVVFNHSNLVNGRPQFRGSITGRVGDNEVRVTDAEIAEQGDFVSVVAGPYSIEKGETVELELKGIFENYTGATVGLSIHGKLGPIEINGVPVHHNVYLGRICEPEPGILWLEDFGNQMYEMLDRSELEMEEDMLALMKEADWSGIVGFAVQLDGAPDGTMEMVQAGLSQLPWISGSQAGAAAGVVALAGDLDVSDGQVEIGLRLLCDDSDAAKHLKNLLDALVDVPESDFGAENLDDILDGIEIKLDGSSVSVDITVDTEAFMGVFTSVTGGF